MTSLSAFFGSVPDSFFNHSTTNLTSVFPLMANYGLYCISNSLNLMATWERRPDWFGFPNILEKVGCHNDYFISVKIVPEFFRSYHYGERCSLYRRIYLLCSSQIIVDIYIGCCHPSPSTRRTTLDYFSMKAKYKYRISTTLEFVKKGTFLKYSLMDWKTFSHSSLHKYSSFFFFRSWK